MRDSRRRRQSERRKARSERLREGPMAILVGGDRLCGGHPPAAGHAGRAQLKRLAAVT